MLEPTHVGCYSSGVLCANAFVEFSLDKREIIRRVCVRIQKRLASVASGFGHLDADAAVASE